MRTCEPFRKEATAGFLFLGPNRRIFRRSLENLGEVLAVTTYSSEGHLKLLLGHSLQQCNALHLSDWLKARCPSS